jgi:Spy/CpxP family protein refolding chaperone
MKMINSSRFGAGLSLAVLLLLLTFSPTRVSAQEEGGGPPRQQGQGAPLRPDGDLVRQLNLSPEQIEKIKAIREQNRDLRRQFGQRIRAAQIALDRAIYFEGADEAVVEQRSRELAEAQAAQTRLQAMTALMIRRILTPEQLETFRALRQQAEQERRNRRAQGDEEGGPPVRRGRGGPGQPDGRQGLPLRRQGGRP